MSRQRLRQGVLLASLVTTLLACAWSYRQESVEADVVAPVERVAANQSAQPELNVAPKTRIEPGSETRLDLERLTKREFAGTDIDPFRAKTWYVPPPPPPPEPPPKPTAPPLPFQFVGKSEEAGSGKPAVYLSAGNEFYTVVVGDKFANNYQLERVDRGVLVIRYLPLSIIQTLPIGSSE